MRENELLAEPRGTYIGLNRPFPPRLVRRGSTPYERELWLQDNPYRVQIAKSLIAEARKLDPPLTFDDDRHRYGDWLATAEHDSWKQFYNKVEKMRDNADSKFYWAIVDKLNAADTVSYQDDQVDRLGFV